MFIESSKYDNLVLFAHKLSWLYFSNVYLVGSSLKGNDFNDVDLIVLMDDIDFERKFGSLDRWHDEISGKEKEIKVANIWANSCYKQWVMGCKITSLKLDLKILPKKFCKIFEPYKRLDTFTKNI